MDYPTKRVLLIAPEAAGLPALAWMSELTQIAQVPGVQLEVCGGKIATRAAVAAKLREYWDCIIWSGHGAPGRLMLTDGPVGSDWLACMMRQTPPGVIVLAACFSGTRDQALNSLAEALHQSGVTVVGMMADVLDAAAVLYNVEFTRALAQGARLWDAHRAAVEQLAWEHPGQAGIPFMLAGANANSRRIEQDLGDIKRRLDVVEVKLDRLCTVRGC